MPVPDKWANEPTVEIDRDLYAEWLAARAEAKRWKQIQDLLAEKLTTELGSATAGVIDGVKVLTHRPAENWATARIIEDYPDLAQHFMIVQRREVLDIEAFRLRHPDIAARYQVRNFRDSGQ